MNNFKKGLINYGLENGYIKLELKELFFENVQNIRHEPKLKFHSGIRPLVFQKFTLLFDFFRKKTFFSARSSRTEIS